MLRNVILVGLVLCGSGCMRYFKVSEPGGGRDYYTTRVDDQANGAIRFTDLKTGSRVTLQSSEVKEVKKADLPTDLQTR
jgi:hypothetical protein